MTTGQEDFHRDKHISYIASLDKRRDELEYWLTEHLRLSAIYWGYTCLHLLGSPETLNAGDVLKYVLDCQNEDGGFGGHSGHDSHLLYTLSAVQLLVLLRALDRIDRDRIVQFVVSRQQADGSFTGDRWGERDTRFSYCALSCLKLLGRLNSPCPIDIDKTVSFIQQCMNFDGGFGSLPGSESHAGQVFCCVGALAIADRLDVVDRDSLAWWLSERQLPCGGLNGRPEKLQDVCYSWWVVASLAMLDRLEWIDGEALSAFILQCQDPDGGGIADRPEDIVDVFHTFFGVCGLSMMGKFGLGRVDPVYCLPVEFVPK